MVHIPFLRNDFVWLDHVDIEGMHGVLPISHLPNALVSRYGSTGFYRPMVTLLHSIDFAMFGLQPLGYHLTSILLHLGVSITGVLFLDRFFHFTKREKYLSLLIIGLAPVSWSSVGLISNVSELTVLLFSLLCVYFYTRAKLLPMIVMGICALLSKETALFWIPALSLLWRQQNRLLLAVQLLTALIYILIRSVLIPEVWRTLAVSLSLSQSIGTRFNALCALLLSVVSPLAAHFSDATLVVSLYYPGSLVFLLCVLGGIYVVYRFGLHSAWGKVIGLTAVFMLPAANILPLPRFSSPNYGYALVISLAAMAVLLTRQFHGKAVYVLLAMWLSIAAVETMQVGPRMRNDFTLFAPEVSANNAYREGHFYLGYYFYSHQNIAAATNEFELSLLKSPGVISFVDESAARENLILTYSDRAQELYSQGKKDEAIELLMRMRLLLNPTQQQKLDEFIKKI